MFKVIKVDLFRGFYVAGEFETDNPDAICGEQLTKAEWEEFDDDEDVAEDEKINFDYDFVILDKEDDCLVYFIKKLQKN